MIETILSIVAGLGGITGIISLFYVKQEQKSKELDNESKDLDNEAKQSDEWRKLYEEERKCFLQARQEYDAVIKDKDEKIDELYKEVSNQRNQKVELHNKVASMNVELTKLKMLKCETVNCINRKPPTGY